MYLLRISFETELVILFFFVGFTSKKKLIRKEKNCRKNDIVLVMGVLLTIIKIII